MQTAQLLAGQKTEIKRPPACVTGVRIRTARPGAAAESKWERQIAGWVSAAARGHEVGNHTTHHPCSCNYGFSDPCLEEMTIEDIAATIDDAEVCTPPVSCVARTSLTD